MVYVSSIDKFLIEAGKAQQSDGNASVDKAWATWLVIALRPLAGDGSALMPHQTIGAAWMLDTELTYFKGGCLADDMGLRTI